ncbi:hypothetical protein GB931_05490 [Modestobacter sp. I12A-02628]|uniref:Lipoprotein n=1 Tax=Goekera deserti TaxID=2497753 RepID=A0A7K3WBB6_9ACTN|nr:hypothetical protein [Goekera deserti]MPQ97386.1 hypothetical protein [Goekera deserti]NDI48013.1 hypothetical protein [Goekera deserti]NEL53761.1 hypothetical protein [Goekera deserti]
MRPRTALPTALAGLLLVAGCTSGGSDGAPGTAQEDAEGVVTTSAPDAASSLVADTDPAASAVSTSRALFDSSPVAVVAAADDPAAQLMASSAAVGLGVPLLVTAAGDDPAGVVVGELDRLGATAVLAVGADAAGALADGGAGEDRDVVTVPADAAAVEEATGLTLADADPVAPDGGVAAVAALDPADPAGLRPDGAAPDDGAEADGELPGVQRADPLTDVVVLASGSAESLAGTATARAAGARVVPTGGQTDPRASADVVEALGTDRPAAVLALGADFGAQDGFDWKLATAATGTQLPGGGQTLFPGRLMVALYGVPGSGALGVLGEQDLPASIQRAKDTAAPYDELVETPVVPTFEIIATVASDSAGPDGDYSTELDIEQLRPWVDAAGEAGVYVVLDLQPGREDFLGQARQYQPLLELPHVGLALDPEWRLGPGELPLQQIGRVGIDEVNQVVTWLADLTREKALPQKLLVLHQFQVRMITDRERLDTSRDELALMVHVDGQGSQPAKQDTWRVLHTDAPAPLYWGWKNFYDEDEPMLTPAQTIEQALPTPELVTYQ